MKMNMRKLLALLATVAMMLAVLPLGTLFASAAGNLIANGDFENGNTDGWQTWGASTVKADSQDVGAGRYSARVDVKDDWAPVTVTLTLKKNTDYVLTFKYKDNNSRGITVNLQKTDWSDPVLRLPVDGVNVWTEYTKEFNSGDNDILMFHFQSNCTASESQVFWLDDVVLTEKGDTPPANSEDYYIETFESGDLNGWVVAGNGGSGITTEAAAHGTHSIMVKGTMNEDYDNLVTSKPAAVKAGVTYTMSFFAKNMDGVADGAVYALGVTNYANEDGTGRLEQLVNTTWPSFDKNWKEYSFQFTASKDGYAGAMFVNVNANFYLDNFMIYPSGQKPETPWDSSSESFDGFIVNGDFETGDGTGWSINGDAAVTEEAAETGKYGVKLTGTGSWNDSAYTIFPVEPGEQYTLTYSIKTIKGGPATLFLRGGMEGEAWKCAVELKGDQTLVSSSGDWKNMLQVIDPGDCKYVVVHFNGGSGGTHYIDNVKVTPNGAASNDGYITNGDFELNNGIGWSLEGTGAITEEAAETGKYGVQLTGTSTWGDKASTVIAVEPGKQYTLTYSLKTASGGPATLYLRGGMTEYEWQASVVLPGDDVPIMSTGDWQKMTHCIDPGDCTYVVIHFNGADGGVNYIDNVRVTEGWTDPGDKPLPPLTLSTFGVLNNRPLNASDNLLINGSFESDANAQWNTGTFLGENVYVVDDDTTRSGNKSLYFNTSGNKLAAWHIFWVDVEPGKDYVFSTWLKGAYISDDNRFAATVGVVDPDTKTFMVHKDTLFSSVTEQIVPTAWDNKWHLRSVSFNSGEKTKVGIALYGHSSQMWVDDMALYLIDAGVKYSSGADSISVKDVFEDIGCTDENSLIVDPTFSTALSNDFWSTGGGWKNGFLSFVENEYEYRDSMKYTESSDPRGLYYTKWIDIKPNTDYVFSVDMKILKDGDGKLMVMGGRATYPLEFIQIDFSGDVWGTEWFNKTFTFNSGLFSRVAITVVDKGGEALIDNLRIFEASKKVAMEDEFVSRANGWHKVDGNWVYYENGRMVTNKWKMDSVGWCYLGADGYCVTNKWVADSKGWCYLDANGRMVTNKWVMDSVGWCYVDGNGYCVTNKWVADSKGWCYLDGNGRMVTNKWVMDSVGWCYVGADGYCVTNKWVADSYGWCYLDGNGRMVTNKWIKDSVGWCYIGAEGYCLTNQWVEDSKGFCYLDENGRMVYDTWVDGVYYVDSNGYWVAK